MVIYRGFGAGLMDPAPSAPPSTAAPQARADLVSYPPSSFLAVRPAAAAIRAMRLDNFNDACDRKITGAGGVEGGAEGEGARLPPRLAASRVGERSSRARFVAGGSMASRAL